MKHLTNSHLATVEGIILTVCVKVDPICFGVWIGQESYSFEILSMGVSGLHRLCAIPIRTDD
jgi:hypothetical protein